MNIQPSPQMLNAIRSQNLDWRTCLSEIIDNSFDAKASRCEIECSGRKLLKVIDDGKGCDNLERMFSYGDSYEQHSGIRLGRYGVGLKDASLWMANCVEVSSASKGKLRHTAINWGEIIRTNNWSYGQEPSECVASEEACAMEGIHGLSGTKLKFTHLLHNFPTGENLRPVLDDIGFTFHPAILSGKQILVTAGGKRYPVPAYRLPEMTDIVDQRVDIGKGKQIHVVAGIVPQGVPNKRSGFAYVLHHRVIETTGLGCKQYSSSRICGCVELIGDWLVSKNKTSILDDDQAALEDAVFSVVQPILMKSESQSLDVHNRNLMIHLSERLSEALAKARRSKGTKSGTVTPKNSGRKAACARVTQPGTGVLGPRSNSGFRVQFTDNESYGVGRVDMTNNCVELCNSHPYIQTAKQRQSAGADVLLLLATCMYLGRLALHGDKPEIQKILPGMMDARGHDNFIKALTEGLAGLEQCDDQASKMSKAG